MLKSVKILEKFQLESINRKCLPFLPGTISHNLFAKGDRIVRIILKIIRHVSLPSPPERLLE